MHYYKRNLGDYAKKAGRLSMLQHGAYTLLIDACYDREQFPTMAEAIDWTWASSTAEIEAVEFVLRKFFTLEGDRFVQKRIQEEISEYRVKAEVNARIAQERETKRKEKSTKRAPVVDGASEDGDGPPPNQEPITNNQLTPSNEGVARTLQGEACMAMKAAGMAGVNPSHPKLTALLEAGITVPELVAAAADAVDKGKPFAYALASAEGRRRDAATAPLPNVQPDAPIETYAQRAARQRMEEVAPMAARKAPGSAFDAAQRFMRGDVVDVTPAPQQLQVM